MVKKAGRPKRSRNKNSPKEIDGIKFRSLMQSGAYLDLKQKIHLGLVTNCEIKVPLHVWMGVELIFKVRHAFYYERAGFKIVRIVPDQMAAVNLRIIEFAFGDEMVLEVYPRDVDALDARCRRIESLRRNKNENRTKIQLGESERGRTEGDSGS